MTEGGSDHIEFLGSFEALDDPRQQAKVLYPLPEILLLCLCAVLGGADSWVEVALYGRHKLAFGPLSGRYLAALGRFRVVRSPSSAHSGPLRALQGGGGTLGYPLNARQRQFHPVLISASAATAEHTSTQAGRFVDASPRPRSDQPRPARRQYRSVNGALAAGGVADMGSRWQLRVQRSERAWVHIPVQRVIHNVHRMTSPSPGPHPVYRHRL